MNKKKLGGMTMEHLLELRKSNFEVECVCCKQKLPIKKFSYKKVKSSGLYYIDYNCTPCLYKKRMVKYEHKSSLYNATQLYKEQYTIEGRAALLVNRSRGKAVRYNLEFNLSKQIIIDKMYKGVCEATGIPLDFSRVSYNPYSPSIDRIDSSRGYTDDNVQVVCMIYNFCKNAFTTEQVTKFLKDANPE